MACEMIRAEVDTALAEVGADLPVVWVDDTLHVRPAKLRGALQEHIDRLDQVHGAGVEHLLFAFGFCGNALVGLHTRAAGMVVPRVNDCVEMLLLGQIERPSTLGSYFLTKGWIESDRAIVKEYDHYIRRYGERRAKRIMSVLLAHYHSLMLVDTGAYDVAAYESVAREAAARLGLDFEIGRGSTRVLEELFSGRWEQGFCLVPPHTEIEPEHFGADYTCAPLAQGQSYP